MKIYLLYKIIIYKVYIRNIFNLFYIIKDNNIMNYVIYKYKFKN